MLNSKTNNYIWNTIGGILSAGQSAVMLMIITRLLGLSAAGVYSIAFATGNLFLILGNYGVRYYQVSDLNERHTFVDYAVHRMLTVIMMLVVSVGYCGYSYLFGGYSAEKAWTVLAMCVLKVIDGIEDVIGGRYQQQGRLDQAGKLLTVRLLFSITGMAIVMVVTHNLLTAVIYSIVIAVLVDIVIVWLFRATINWQNWTLSWDSVKTIMLACFPVCAVNFLSYYLANAPKYAIDSLLNETSQAEYNFIAMPVYVIQLFSTFLFQPIIVDLTQAWDAQDKRRFSGCFNRIGGALLLASVVVLVGAWLLGIPVLSLLYATDLTSRKADLMILLVGGVFLAYSGFLCAVLTITRDQKKILMVYVIGTVCALVITGNMTAYLDIRGAVCSFTTIMFVVFALLAGVYARAIHRMGS